MCTVHENMKRSMSTENKRLKIVWLCYISFNKFCSKFIDEVVFIMAKGLHIKKLFQSVKEGNLDSFKVIAQSIIEDERSKSHSQLANDLQKILDSTSSEKKSLSQSGVNYLHLLPKDKDSNQILMDIQEPNADLSELVLQPDVEHILREYIQEYEDHEILAAYGLPYKKKFLFCGPPGCGKTATAYALSTELNIPVLYTRFDSVVSSYLGETASNLRKIFDFASNGTWILFFDEFDAIGKKRDSIDEHGELKRVVNTFLQLLDGFKDNNSIVIAATNHQSLLDPALWRRFDEVILFEKPNKDQIQSLVSRQLNRYPHARINIEDISASLAGFSHADIEKICISAVKKAVMSRMNQVTSDLLVDQIQLYKKRYEIYNQFNE